MSCIYSTTMRDKYAARAGRITNTWRNYTVMKLKTRISFLFAQTSSTMTMATIVCTVRGVRRAATRFTTTSVKRTIVQTPTAKANPLRRVFTVLRRAAVVAAIVAAVTTTAARTTCRSAWTVANRTA